MIIAGTGHRPNKLGGYSEEATAKVRNVALNYLGIVRPEKVISGMALGWDQQLAWAAVLLGIPLLAAVPFEGQERAWPKQSQQEFLTLLAKAGEVVHVSEGGYAPWKMQVRNQWMVDNCDRVLALWNGTDGGTGNCVEYAKKAGKPIVNLWNEYEQS